MSSFTIYTDGGCKSPGGVGGWACIVKNNDNNTSKVMFGNILNATNNVAELTAVSEGFLRLVTEPNITSVTLISDSEYVVKGIKEWLPTWESAGWKKSNSSKPILNKELWQTINWYVGQYKTKLTVLHVYGHSGHPENEMCDRLATEAMELYDRDTNQQQTDNSSECSS